MSDAPPKNTSAQSPPENNSPSLLDSLKKLALPILAIIIIGVSWTAVGYYFGSSAEEKDAEETLKAITRSVEDANLAGTALIQSYTATSTLTPPPTSTLLPSATFTPEIPQAQVLSVSAAVRLGPGTEYPVVASLSQDTAVEITGFSETGDWLQISFTMTNGEPATGFVQAGQLQVTGGSLAGIAVANYPTLTHTPSPTSVPPTATATRTPNPTALPSLTSTPPTPQARVLPIIASVRLGPGAEYPVIDFIRQDTPVEIRSTSEDGLWFDVLYQNADDEWLDGFVEGSSLQLTGGTLSGLAVAVAPTLSPTPSPTFTPDIPTVTASPSYTPGPPVAYAAGYLGVVREGPAEAFTSVGAVDAQTPLEVTAISPDGLWLQVRFDGSRTGLGWVSLQTVQVIGSVGVLPVVQGPPLPTPIAVAGGGTGGLGTIATPIPSNTNNTGSGSSAGSSGPVTPAPLPTNLQVDYDALPDLDAYAYGFNMAIIGQGDGERYESTITFYYGQSATPLQNRVTIDVTGAFIQLVAGDDDISTITDILPITLGGYEGRNYVHSGVDDFCVDVGTDLDIDNITTELLGILGEDGDSFFDEIGEGTVFGVVDSNGLAGIPGIHYQLLGLGTPDNYAGTTELKADLWWTTDESLLTGYRLVFEIGDNTFIDRAAISTIDPAIANYESFEGTLTVELLPTGINDAALIFAAPPESCNLPLGIQ